MTEQRKTERVKAMIFTTAYDVNGNTLLGYLGDLTIKGAMVVGEKPAETNRNITMRIEFRGADEIPASHLIIPAHVAWCKQEEETDFYNTGYEFVELSGLNKEIVELIVERYRFDLNLPD